MSITPAHIHLMFQNTTDVHKFGVEAAKPEAIQHQLTEHAQRENAHEHESVVKLNKSEKQSINEREGSGEGYYGNKKKKKGKDSGQEETKEKKSDGVFDIRI